VADTGSNDQAIAMLGSAQYFNSSNAGENKEQHSAIHDKIHECVGADLPKGLNSALHGTEFLNVSAHDLGRFTIDKAKDVAIDKLGSVQPNDELQQQYYALPQQYHALPQRNDELLQQLLQLQSDQQQPSDNAAQTSHLSFEGYHYLFLDNQNPQQ
jgi:hypothetical protein